MLYRKREQMVAVFPSGLQIFLSVSLKVPHFSSHAAKQHCITLISELFCIRNGVCVMMPGFGTFHHLKEQQLTLQLFTTRCAWPHLPFPLISMGNPPDTNHYHGPCPAKPTERVSTGFSGSRWKFCVPTFPPFNTWSHRAVDSASTLLKVALVLGSPLSFLHPILLENSIVMG